MSSKRPAQIIWWYFQNTASLSNFQNFRTSRFPSLLDLVSFGSPIISYSDPVFHPFSASQTLPSFIWNLESTIRWIPLTTFPPGGSSTSCSNWNLAVVWQALFPPTASPTMAVSPLPPHAPGPRHAALSSLLAATSTLFPYSSSNTQALLIHISQVAPLTIPPLSSSNKCLIRSPNSLKMFVPGLLPFLPKFVLSLPSLWQLQHLTKQSTHHSSLSFPTIFPFVHPSHDLPWS